MFDLRARRLPSGAWTPHLEHASVLNQRRSNGDFHEELNLRWRYLPTRPSLTTSRGELVSLGRVCVLWHSGAIVSRLG